MKEWSDLPLEDNILKYSSIKPCHISEMVSTHFSPAEDMYPLFHLLPAERGDVCLPY